MNARWKVLAACAALALAVTACGEDKGKTTDDNPIGGDDSGANGNSNGNSTSGSNGANNDGDNDGDGGRPVLPPLDAGVAGKACATDTECGAGGTCVLEGLRGASFGGVSVGSSLTPGGYCSRSCSEAADCGEGGLCFIGAQGRRGECRKACSADGDCGRAEYECAKLNRPIADEDTGANVDVPTSCQAKRTIAVLTNEVANACTDNSMCGTNGLCRTSGNQGIGDYPGGYCSGYCNSNADCGQDGSCVLRAYGHGGSCYESCSVDTDCKRDAMNYGCVDLEDGAGTKACLGEMDPLQEGFVGNACTDNTMCGNAQCAQRVGTMNTPAPGGYCSVLGCEADVDCSSTGVCAITDNGSRCYKACKANTDCREGYTCAVYGNNMKNVCFPIATTGDAGTPSP